MRIALLLIGFVAFLGPMVWALGAGPAEKPFRVEVWFAAQTVTLVAFGLAWWLRQRSMASWLRCEGTIVGARQTGMYEHGVLALRLEVEHDATGPVMRAVTKVRAPALETSRYSIGARVSLAVNPRRPQEVRVRS
jgi:hypothetical protein